MKKLTRRILFISRKSIYTVGGMEKFNKDIIKYFNKFNNWNYDILNIRKQNYLLQIAFLIKKIFLGNYHNFDLIHLSDLTIWPVILKIKNKEIIINVHGTDFGYIYKKNLLSTFYLFYLKLAKFFINKKKITLVCNSNFLKKKCKIFGFKNVKVIYHGIKIEKFFPTKKKKNQILFLGRIQASKGMSWFVNNVFYKLDKNFKLIVAGPIFDRKEFNKINFNSRIKYIGSVYGNRKKKIIRNSLCVIMPNINTFREIEGFGYVGIEIANYSGFLLAHCLDGIKESVGSSKFCRGFCLTYKSSKKWTNVIKKLSLLNVTEYNLLKKKFHTNLIDQFNIKRMMSKYELIYNS